MIEAIKKAKKDAIKTGLIPTELYIGNSGTLMYSDEIELGTTKDGRMIYNKICGLSVICDPKIPEGKFYIR